MWGGASASEKQAVLFNRSSWTVPEAEKWLNEQQLKPIKRVHETDRFLHYRLRDPGYFKKFRTIKTDKGIEFVIGYK